MTTSLLSRAELRLSRIAGPFEVLDIDDLDPGLGGCVLIAEHGPDHSSYKIGVRASLSFARRERFAVWATERILRFLEHGPEPDGWQKRTLDGAWQLWAREVLLPDPS